MTKLDMSLKIAEQVGVDQVVAGQIVQATLDAIIEVLATDGRLELRDFGVARLRPHAARCGPYSASQVQRAPRRTPCSRN